jgi:hypothetical protein
VRAPCDTVSQGLFARLAVVRTAALRLPALRLPALRLPTLRLPALVLTALALSGCAGFLPGHGDGTATLWVTRDRGAAVLLDTTVPAGATLMQALRSKAKVDTRYGGRFVESIDGLAGNAGAQRDWFWYVNGLLGDRSAAEYRLRVGDVAWWDYRSWRQEADIPVVVGAFPEPFRHGYAGHVRPTAVRYAAGLAAAAATLRKELRATSVAPLGTRVPKGENLFELVSGRPRFVAEMREPGSGPQGAVEFVYAGDPAALRPGGVRPFRHRFTLP